MLDSLSKDLVEAVQLVIQEAHYTDLKNGGTRLFAKTHQEAADYATKQLKGGETSVTIKIDGTTVKYPYTIYKIDVHGHTVGQQYTTKEYVDMMKKLSKEYERSNLSGAANKNQLPESVETTEAINESKMSEIHAAREELKKLGLKIEEADKDESKAGILFFIDAKSVKGKEDKAKSILIANDLDARAANGEVTHYEVLVYNKKSKHDRQDIFNESVVEEDILDESVGTSLKNAAKMLLDAGVPEKDLKATLDNIPLQSKSEGIVKVSDVQKAAKAHGKRLKVNEEVENLDEAKQKLANIKTVGHEVGLKDNIIRDGDWTLTDEKTGEPVKVGTKCKTHNEKKPQAVIGGQAPKHSGSTGRAWSKESESMGGYYPSVYGLKWVHKDDKGKLEEGEKKLMSFTSAIRKIHSMGNKHEKKDDSPSSRRHYNDLQHRQKEKDDDKKKEEEKV